MDTLMDDGDMEFVRFACDCGSQAHSLDFYIERNKQGGVIYCSVSPYLAGKDSLRWRIKTAWRNLRGLDGALGDLVIRPEDYPEMVKLGAKLMCNPNTSSTWPLIGGE